MTYLKTSLKIFFHAFVILLSFYSSAALVVSKLMGKDPSHKLFAKESVLLRVSFKQLCFHLLAKNLHSNTWDRPIAAPFPVPDFAGCGSKLSIGILIVCAPEPCPMFSPSASHDHGHREIKQALELRNNPFRGI